VIYRNGMQLTYRCRHFLAEGEAKAFAAEKPGLPVDRKTPLKEIAMSMSKATRKEMDRADRRDNRKKKAATRRGDAVVVGNAVDRIGEREAIRQKAALNQEAGVKCPKPPYP